jgi:hypothetical protein
VRAVSFLFDLGQRPGDALAHVVNVGFLALGVLFDQHLAGNFLFRQGANSGGAGMSVSESCSAILLIKAPLDSLAISVRMERIYYI